MAPSPSVTSAEAVLYPARRSSNPVWTGGQRHRRAERGDADALVVGEDVRARQVGLDVDVRQAPLHRDELEREVLPLPAGDRDLLALRRVSGRDDADDVRAARNAQGRRQGGLSGLDSVDLDARVGHVGLDAHLRDACSLFVTRLPRDGEALGRERTRIRDDAVERIGCFDRAPHLCIHESDVVKDGDILHELVRPAKLDQRPRRVARVEEAKTAVESFAGLRACRAFFCALRVRDARRRHGTGAQQQGEREAERTAVHRNGFSPASPVWSTRVFGVIFVDGMAGGAEGAGRGAFADAGVAVGVELSGSPASGGDAVGSGTGGRATGARATTGGPDARSGAMLAGGFTAGGAFPLRATRNAMMAAAATASPPAVNTRRDVRSVFAAGCTLPIVAASAASVDGTTPEMGPSGACAGAAVDSRTTARGGGTVEACRVRTRIGSSAPPSSRTDEKRASRSAAMARCTTAQNAGESEGRRSCNGTARPSWMRTASASIDRASNGRTPHAHS